MHKRAAESLNPTTLVLRPGPLLLMWISNYIYYKVWNEITFPFPNINSGTVEVWEWISKNLTIKEFNITKSGRFLTEKVT